MPGRRRGGLKVVARRSVRDLIAGEGGPQCPWCRSSQPVHDVDPRRKDDMRPSLAFDMPEVWGTHDPCAIGGRPDIGVEPSQIPRLPRIRPICSPISNALPGIPSIIVRVKSSPCAFKFIILGAVRRSGGGFRTPFFGFHRLHPFGGIRKGRGSCREDGGVLLHAPPRPRSPKHEPATFRAGKAWASRRPAQSDQFRPPEG